MNDPYSMATADYIVAYLIQSDRLHEVLAHFIKAQPDSYDHLKAEQILIEFMPTQMTDHLVWQYVGDVNIRDGYNEWWSMYHHVIV